MHSSNLTSAQTRHEITYLALLFNLCINYVELEEAFFVLGFSIMTIFNLFSNLFGGVAGTNQASGMELFAKISKRFWVAYYFRRKLRLRCLVVLASLICS